jgi:iron complex outermembrane receptor protein
VPTELESCLLFGDGTQFVEASRLRRRLAEFAFDLRPTDRTTIDAHYSVYDIVQRGYPGWFSYGPSSKTNAAAPDYILPSAPDPTRVGFGQAYAGVNLTTQSTSVRLLHDFSPNWHAMAGGLAQRLDRFIDTPVNTITDNTGDYSSSLGSGFAPRFGVESDLGYVTGLIRTGSIQQDVVLASEGYRFNQYSDTANAASALLLGTANVNAPKILPPPSVGLPRNIGLYQSAVVHQQGFNIGDLLSFRNRFLVRVAASQDFIGVDNYTATARTSGSNKEGISPSASVMYKPTLWSTAYATYASSLQQGDIAPISATLINSGQSLSPYRSKEWELGFKTDAHPLAITTSLFRLERPFADTISYNGSPTQNIFAIVGQQVNYGAEISGQGTLFHHLLVDGGFTALNARLNNTNVASTNGKRFVGIPPYKSNFYSEYRVPGIAMLSITGDWQFVGKRPQDDQNLHTTTGYNTFDFGFRYSHILLTKLATLRFTCDNITDTHYFSTIAAGDITGTNASANVAHFGLPRTISSSLQFAF